MFGETITMRVTVEGVPEADAAELDALTRRVRRDLLELDVDQVVREFDGHMVSRG